MSTRLAFERRAKRLVQAKTSDVQKDLRDVGCPFVWTDPRSAAWLDGYKAGLGFAGQVVRS